MKNIMRSLLLFTCIVAGQLFGAMNEKQPKPQQPQQAVQQNSFWGTWAGKAKWIGWAAIPAAVAVLSCYHGEELKGRSQCLNTCYNPQLWPEFHMKCNDLCNQWRHGHNGTLPTFDEVKENLLATATSNEAALVYLKSLTPDSMGKVLGITLSESYFSEIAYDVQTHIVYYKGEAQKIKSDDNKLWLILENGMGPIELPVITNIQANKIIDTLITLAPTQIDGFLLDFFLKSAHASKVLITMQQFFDQKFIPWITYSLTDGFMFIQMLHSDPKALFDHATMKDHHKRVFSFLSSLIQESLNFESDTCPRYYNGTLI